MPFESNITTLKKNVIKMEDIELATTVIRYHCLATTTCYQLIHPRTYMVYFKWLIIMFAKKIRCQGIP